MIYISIIDISIRYNVTKNNSTLRNHRLKLFGLACLVVILNIACRALGGPDDYNSQEMFIQEDVTPIEEEIPQGQKRLSIGIFYEGPADEMVIIDGVQNHFYIYEGTFSITEASDRVEGSISDKVIHAGGAWWGGGVHWDTARDLSNWQTLHISFKSNQISFENLSLAMHNENDRQSTIQIKDYGFKADDTWHDLVIPLSDFTDAGADLNDIYAPLVFIGSTGDMGHSLFIDRVFFSTP